MINAKIELVGQSSFNLKGLNLIVAQKVINEIDSKPFQPVSKMAAVVKAAFNGEDYGWSHTYLTLAFELPLNYIVELHKVQGLVVDVLQNNIMGIGIVTGSFEQIRMLMETSNELCKLLYPVLSHLSYFASCLPQNALQR